MTCLCSELNKGRHQVRGRYGVHLPASAVVQPCSALTKWELLTTLSAVKSDLQKLRCNDWVLDNGLQETCWDDIGKLCFVAVIKQFWLTLTLLQSPVSALSSLSSPRHLNLTLCQGFIQHELFYLSISLISLFTMWQNLRTGDSWVLCGVVCRVCGGNECLVSGLHGGGCRVRDRPPLSCYYTTHCSGLGCRGQYGHLHTDYKYTLALCLGNPGLLAQCVRGSVLYTALATPQPGGYLPGCHHSREWLSALTTQEVLIERSEQLCPSHNNICFSKYHPAHVKYQHRDLKLEMSTQVCLIHQLSTESLLSSGSHLIPWFWSTFCIQFTLSGSWKVTK